MAVTFVRADFLADMSAKELDALSTKLVVGGDPDPLTNAIARAQQTVDLYAGLWNIGVDWEKRLISAIALYEIVSRLNGPDNDRKLAYEAAMKELRDIRDGKFKNLTQRDPLPAVINPGTLGTGFGFGSQDKINTSRF